MVTVMEVKLKLNSLSNVLAIHYNYDTIPQDSNTTTSLLSMKYVAVSMFRGLKFHTLVPMKMISWMPFFHECIMTFVRNMFSSYVRNMNSL